MATVKIPERKYTVCDVCKRDCVGPVHRSISAHLIFKKNALDSRGCACADATQKFDLCDDCAHEVSKALNAVTEKQRELHKTALEEQL